MAPKKLLEIVGAESIRAEIRRLQKLLENVEVAPEPQEDVGDFSDSEWTADQLDTEHVKLPPGITDGLQWGQTIIDFGKKYKDRIYAELVEEAKTNTKTKRYLNWIRGLTDSSPLVQDFQKFLDFYYQNNPEACQGPTFPGTTRVRRLAPASSSSAEKADRSV